MAGWSAAFPVTAPGSLDYSLKRSPGPENLWEVQVDTGLYALRRDETTGRPALKPFAHFVQNHLPVRGAHIRGEVKKAFSAFLFEFVEEAKSVPLEIDDAECLAAIRDAPGNLPPGNGRIEICGPGNLHASCAAEELMDHSDLVEAACREIVEHARDRKSVLIFATGVKHGKHITDVLCENHGGQTREVSIPLLCGEGGGEAVVYSASGQELSREPLVVKDSAALVEAEIPPAGKVESTVEPMGFTPEMLFRADVE
ncbi:MAG: hypothetical protein J7M19_06775 [Planctomycetes bacterium]|nr:hypothetical protein [Planctomycetota bacterium]